MAQMKPSWRTGAFNAVAGLLAAFFSFSVPALGWAADRKTATRREVPPAGASSSTVKTLFANPTRDYCSAPLWVWNDQLTEEQIIGTMRDLAAQQVKQVFVHPRPGLMTPYLSSDWFRLWKAALREATRLDMNVWIYDENSYPSGFAGGFVPDAMPESRGRGLLLHEQNTAPRWSDALLAVYQIEGQSARDVTPQTRAGTELPAGRFVTASVSRAANSPWHGGKCYVDLMYPGVTEKFLDITLGAYRREIGAQFGKRVPGVFTDEPNIRPAGGLPWTDGLPQVFEKRWGYSLAEQLPSLRLPVGDWRRVRHNYYQVLLEQFIAHWAKPYHDYCASNHLEFTGHYWEHEWPNCLGVPDNMAMYAWSQRPAIDILMNQYQEDVHAQFGNLRAVRELGSVANQLGQPRTLCEAYGAGGWDLRFEDMKRIGDWLYVLGVNTLDQHLSYVTIRGARKRDHPQSFSYHEPWWNAYHISAEYFSRLSVALTHGEQVNSVLVIEPTTTAWFYNTEDERDPALRELGSSFQQFLGSLEKAQVEYDIGCEDILKHYGSAYGIIPDTALPARGSRPNNSAGTPNLTVGQRQYEIVVLPPRLENLNGPTMTLLELFLQSGGTVLCCGAPPAYIDGIASQRPADATKRPGWKTVDAAAVPQLLAAQTESKGLAIRRSATDSGILFHHRRQLVDGEILFLVNTSLQNPSEGSLDSRLGGVEQWDLETGTTKPYPFVHQGGRIEAQFHLPPAGSLLLFLSKATRPNTPAKPEQTLVVSPSGDMTIQRVEPNVLVLDFVDITAGGETRSNLYFYRANQFAFQKNGMPRNPWDSAVQFRDELISHKFSPDSGFEATYRFAVEGALPKMLTLVVERPDLYRITCNSQPAKVIPGAWWLDKCFGRIDLTGLIRTGENSLTLKAAPFTIFHELEPVYLLGDFALKDSDHGFTIVPDARLQLGRWNEQGNPLFSAGVSYRQDFNVSKLKGRFRLALPEWYGSVARIVVNGKPAGYIAYAPYECDVTDFIKAGRNSVEVVVVGTLKNTLGPFHNGPGVGSAWPGMFQKGPESGPPAGAQYATIGYGLFKPFVLTNVQ